MNKKESLNTTFAGFKEEHLIILILTWRSDLEVIPRSKFLKENLDFCSNITENFTLKTRNDI